MLLMQAMYSTDLCHFKCFILFCRVVAIKNYYPGIRIIIQLLQYQNKVINNYNNFSYVCDAHCLSQMPKV